MKNKKLTKVSDYSPEKDTQTAAQWERIELCKAVVIFGVIWWLS
jgi:hypothetical protein